MRTTSEIYYTIVLATIFIFILIGVIVTAIWRYYHRKRLHEKTLMEFDQTLLQSRLEIQEQTFKTISQELHDNFGQMLTLAKLNLNTLNLDHRQETSEKIHITVDLLTQTIQSIRDLSRNLHADIISQNGLIHALESEVRMIGKLGVQPVFQVYGQPVPLETNKSLIIFRIVQEALQNIVKHAGATILEMTVQFSVDHIRLTIADNGTGFNRAEKNNKGSGLRNMDDRARIIGAQFDMHPAATKGTVITLTIPNS